MADPQQTLTFLAWVRERVGGLATSQSQGRARGEVAITLTGRRADGSTTGSQSRSLAFALAGPADVIGLHPGAIVRRYPAPGAIDHESDRCPYVEFAEPSLPWRYTPAGNPAAGTGGLHPWLVLVVGVEGSELELDGDHVTIAPEAQVGVHALGNPGSAYRFAHVQVDAQGHRTARVLSARRLEPGTDYLAVLVPAFDDAARPRWTGAATVSVDVYDHWRFRTGVPAGSFEDLAARLVPGFAPESVGRARLHYRRLADAPELEVRGALVAAPTDETEPDDAPLPQPVADDLAGLRLPARDPEGRPIVALPRYGDAWDASAPDAAEWARTLNGDPRHRGVAGLGLEVGIRFQEELVADALAHLGALAEARQRLRHAVLGAEVAKSLWRRRVPESPVARLSLLGPSLPRLMTDRGPVGELATADDRTLPRGVFSAAARRTLRTGPARTTLPAEPPRPAAVLDAANRPPPPPPSSIDGVPLEAVGVQDFDRGRRLVVQAGRVNPKNLLQAAGDLVTRADPRVQGVGSDLLVGLRRATELGRPAPWGPALAILLTADADTIGASRDPAARAQRLGRALTRLRDRFADEADDADLAELVRDVAPSTASDPVVTEVDLQGLATGVAEAFDPTTGRAPVVTRVLDTVSGVDPAQPLAPPELCVGLDRPMWADVERAFDEWLIPGVGDLPENAVISLETNPVFIDAFLTGANTQLLSELRWRNIPVATGCTPLRRFWDRADTATGERADEVVGLHLWAADSALGAASHRPGGEPGRDLVVIVRGALFLRYPSTIVFLQSALHGSEPDFDHDPADDAPRILPGFQGRIGKDVAFFGFSGVPTAAMARNWLVFEEPPAGYRFANDVVTAATNGHEWAADTLAQPVRVLIRGDSLVPETP
jgi:hypothetical protein